MSLITAATAASALSLRVARALGTDLPTTTKLDVRVAISR